MGIGCLLTAMVIGVTSGWAAEETAPAVVLTKDGEKLRTNYSDLLSTLHDGDHQGLAGRARA